MMHEAEIPKCLVHVSTVRSMLAIFECICEKTTAIGLSSCRRCRLPSIKAKTWASEVPPERHGRITNHQQCLSETNPEVALEGGFLHRSQCVDAASDRDARSKRFVQRSEKNQKESILKYASSLTINFHPRW